MSQFDKVSVVKKANVYFEGKVTSRAVILEDGTKITLGIMLPGEYEFGTGQKEIMDIQSGELSVLLPGQSEWLEISEPTKFEVPANSSFKLVVKTVTDYICSYLD
ncbi:MAG: pyrimidine/purine nucleoside phosphorylase [Candidatus Cohnella colombiensis]|uniref:Pyrimidine/purine nucleoside phosphorylase n=1 Tax=Candidatus Cohnella colombiensis TaxID=3121368 RepID=A0AA95EX51_9BACL|nr:MAG: pyrimidine/purine nucleoside phosphorylase [Cohnella sp.]